MSGFWSAYFHFIAPAAGLDAGAEEVDGGAVVVFGGAEVEVGGAELEAGGADVLVVAGGGAELGVEEHPTRMRLIMIIKARHPKNAFFFIDGSSFLFNLLPTYIIK